MAVGAVALLLIGATLAFAPPGLPMFHLPVVGIIFIIAGSLLLVVSFVAFRLRRSAKVARIK
jgi:uncharacterized RDD family membrane protein YckC